MNNLAQFYTQDNISKLLLSKILIKNPKNILELGVGDGSLFREAQKKWKNSVIIGGDIDRNNVNTLQAEFPTTNLYVINGLSSKLNEDLKIELGSIDVAICNPPYLALKKDDNFAEIIKKSNLGEISDYPQITSDLVFLAQNLLLLRNGGELGIIIPDGLLTSHYFKIFREKIIFNYKVKAIIELPSKVFIKTEAKTHILILKKGDKTNDLIPLYLSNKFGEIINKILVRKDNLSYRMDYKFHYWNSINKTIGKTLEELGVEIFRGQASKKTLIINGDNFIHTSDLKNQFEIKRFKININSKNLRSAESGDILMSRVGKRCLGKIIVVKEGSIIISDCVYRIRIPNLYKEDVIQAFNSEYGRNWIKAHSHGVCAKIISKTDLLNFKVIIK